MERVIFDLVKKELHSIPTHVFKKLNGWARAVELRGIREVRKLPGYHDEALQGKRRGQRSIRLSRSYRAIYREEEDGIIILIIILEVNKHEY